MLLKFLLNFSLIASLGTWLLFNPVEIFGAKKLENRAEKKTEIVAINQLSSTELETIAAAITVRVNVGEYSGSGILIARENNSYTVITNAHVAERGNSYSIETRDGVKHSATLTNQNTSETDKDLALLKFESDNNYQIAKLGDSNKLTVGESIT